MRAVDGASFLDVAATTATFPLRGGRYGVDATATFGGGSVKLQKVLADGSTVASVSSGTDFSADGYTTIGLPAGQYQFTVDTATGVYARIARIPGE